MHAGTISQQSRIADSAWSAYCSARQFSCLVERAAWPTISLVSLRLHSRFVNSALLADCSDRPTSWLIERTAQPTSSLVNLHCKADLLTQLRWPSLPTSWLVERAAWSACSAPPEHKLKAFAPPPINRPRQSIPASPRPCHHPRSLPLTPTLLMSIPNPSPHNKLAGLFAIRLVGRAVC